MKAKINMDVQQLIIETVAIEEQMKKISNKANTNRVMINEYFEKNNIDKLEVESTNGIITATKVERVYVDYYPDKLEKNLDKEIFNLISTKEYEVNDIEGLIKLLKKYYVPPKEFKKHIVKKVQIQKQMIEKLFERGKIKKEDLDNTYKAKIVKSVMLKKRGS